MQNQNDSLATNSKSSQRQMATWNNGIFDYAHFPFAASKNRRLDGEFCKIFDSFIPVLDNRREQCRWVPV